MSKAGVVQRHDTAQDYLREHYEWVDSLHSWRRKSDGLIAFTHIIMHEYAAERERAAYSAGQAEERKRCAKVAEHFKEELTPEEWPPHGLCEAAKRCDSGFTAVTAERIAAAIRQGQPEGEK